MKPRRVNPWLAAPAALRINRRSKHPVVWPDTSRWGLFLTWVLAALALARTTLAADIAVNLGATCNPTEVTVYVGDSIAWWSVGQVRDLASWNGDWQSPTFAPAEWSPAYSRQFDTVGTSVYVQRWYDDATNTVWWISAGTITVLPREAGRPAVLINAPRDGAHFSAGETVPLLASVYDPPGETLAVEFFVNGVSIGSVATPPYGLQWTNAPVGTNLVVCRLSGVAGETAESPPVRILALAGNAAFLASPRILPGGLFAFDFTVPAWPKYEIQSSTDLQAWEVVRFTPFSGTYIDVAHPNQPRLFFRLMQHPLFAAQVLTGSPPAPLK